MFLPLFYIVPAVLLIVCVGLLLVIRHGMPAWLRKLGVQAQVGGLNDEDIEKLDGSQRTLLARVVGGYLSVTATITLITSTVVVLQGHGSSPLMAVICTGVEAAAALLMLRPLAKACQRYKE